MNLYKVMLIVILFTACNSSGKEYSNSIAGDDNNETVEAINKSQRSSVKQNQFSLNDVTWNEGLGLIEKLDVLKRKFPSIRTIKKPDMYDMLQCDSLAYINKTKFEKCESSNCRLLSLEFDDIVNEISIGNKSLNQNTSMSTLYEMFEECTTLKDLKVYGDTTTFKTCFIRSNVQDFGLLIFTWKGTIVKVDIWEPS